MEGEVGAQVAPLMFLHRHHQMISDATTAATNAAASTATVAALAKKRGYPWQVPPPTARQILPNSVGPAPLSDPAATGNNSSNWNPTMWQWDSRRLSAKPAPIGLGLGKQPATAGTGNKAEVPAKAATLRNRRAEDDTGLRLQLGGGPYSAEEMVAETSVPMPSPATAPMPAAQEQVVRPNKRVRSGSPGNGGCGSGGGGGGGGSYPICQVDDCRVDLSNAKDYHRRHKVCEAHSKTTKALVAGQMQRFCQQCSRFHPLSEFDEGKRSCRRRLAGHNRRRRKTQPTDVASQLLVPGNHDNAANRNMDIVNLITVLARLQGDNTNKSPIVPPIPDKDGLAQILSKINSLNAVNPNSRLPGSGGAIDQTASRRPQQDVIEQTVTGFCKQTDAPSTMNLLAVLSPALAASPPETNASNSQGSSGSSGNAKSKSQSVEPAVDVNSDEKAIPDFPLTGIKGSNCTFEIQSEAVQEDRPFLSLQLFGTAVDAGPPKADSSVKYLSSESSNPLDDRSPSSSPPVTHKFFPLHSADKDTKDTRMADYTEDTATVEVSTNRAWCAPLELFRDLEQPVEHDSPLNLSQPGGYASTSSDHSPSTSNSDGQDRTGRIIFKLFGKEPSTLPINLRDQILNWLKHSPSEMEGYIRPGCLVLSIYLSMPPIAWDEFEETLLKRVNLLVQGPESDFWRNGRFLVRTDRQLVSHKHGMVRLSKSWKTWSSPELTSVSPIAIVCGQKTSIILKGRNLTVPGTKIHCTSMGKYISKEVLCSAYPGTIYDDSSVESFDFPGETHLLLGRCFIEVENGFKGNSFPVIIAEPSICLELRTLETELENYQTVDGVLDNWQSKSKENIFHFLNELGWLFQKAEAYATSYSPDVAEPSFIGFPVTRFKHLLMFSTDRNWCSLTKKLLDILVKRNLATYELSQETLEMLSQVHLLNRAVKKKCRKMVQLLVQFVVVCSDDSKVYPFPPNLPGSGGLTPLHLSASLDNAEEIVDALTDDAQQIGLDCWNYVLDNSGQTPQMYAKLRNNHSYNELVMRKLVDKKNAQVSIVVNGDEISMDESRIACQTDWSGLRSLEIRSCAKCAMLESSLHVRPCRSQGLLARPFIHSMLAIAAVCVCVCVFMRNQTLKWECLDFGAI